MFSERQIDRLKRLGRRNPIVQSMLKSVELGGIELDEGVICCLEALDRQVMTLMDQLAKAASPRAVSVGSNKAEVFSDLVSRSMERE